ncbi:MAG TPA: APC family permease [Candidatus Acidoferrum sp.]|nr:APC family permease [Candidatus Acidoferrum sp.]
MVTPARSADDASLGGGQLPGEMRGYGLRREILSPMETLAQSVSTISPSSTPAVTIPLVCALAGNGTWLAYLLATIGVLLVALCVASFARHSSSPGSLYIYAAKVLPRWLTALVAWSLLLAYVATASSVIGGFYQYAILVLLPSHGGPISAVLLAIIVTAISMWVAWRDVKVSARLMLWIEAMSLLTILIVVVLVLAHRGLHLDASQIKLQGMTGSGLRLGLVLAIFSFVGFESATTLGAEARNPLKTIPRAVIQSALLAGAMFVACAYTEVLGFHMVGQNLGDSQAPMQTLAGVAGAPVLGTLINIGVLVSLFACTLACVTAAARVLLLMAHTGLVHGRLRDTHEEHETPHIAIVVTGIAAGLPAVVLAARGASGLDVYGWMGSLATYGFIVTYALVAAALPAYLRQHGAFRASAVVLSVVACVAMFLGLVGNLYPVPEGPYGKLPYIYLAYLAAGFVWFLIAIRREHSAQARD